MREVKKVLSLVIAFAMLVSTAYAAFPKDPDYPKEITSDPFVRTVSNGGYGVLYSTDFESVLSNPVSGSTNNENLYLIHDFGLSVWGERNNGKDNWFNITTDEINSAYNGNAVEAHDTYGGQVVQASAYFGDNDISGKKLNVSFRARKDRDVDTTSILDRNMVYVELFNNDTGAYNEANRIAGTSGHSTRMNYFIEVMTNVSAESATYGAASMLNGTFNGLANSSAKDIGLDDTDWHQIDGVVDVSNGKANATVTLFIDGTQVYTKTGDFITENAFDAEGNFNFNALQLNIQSETNAWTWVDGFKITNTEGTSFGVTNTKKADSAVYLELSNTVASGQTAPAVKLRKAGTSTELTPAVSFEGSQAIKLDITGLSLDANAEYQIVYPEEFALTDINGRRIDKEQIVTFYTDGDGNGVKEARLVSASGSLSVPNATAMTGITGMELTFEEALTSPNVTFNAEGEEVAVNMATDGSKYTLSWTSLDADYYELIVKDGDTVVYEYKLADVLVIEPVYPEENNYGVLWHNDFEATDLASIGMTKTAYTQSSAERNILADAGEFRGKALTFGSTWNNNTATWSKSFDSDISGKKFNFSYQIKVSDTNATESDISSIQGFNVFNIMLQKDGEQLKGSDTNQNNRGNFIEAYYDYADGYTTSGAAQMLSGAWSGIKSAPQIGLDDLDWHQVDGVIDATTKELKLYIDGNQVYPNVDGGFLDRASDINPLLDESGNFVFDTMDVLMLTKSHTSDNSDQTKGRWGWFDNFKITNTEGASFGVTNTKKIDNAVYLELSNTVASGQTAPAVKLRKAGTSTELTPAVSFEGSQAIKLDITGLSLDANAEYQIVYPEEFALTDINGRSIDKEQIVTFYTDGDGNGVKEARLVNLDNTLSVPTATPSNAVKGIVLTTEATVTSVTATLSGTTDTVDVSVTGSANDWIVGWNKFLKAEEYTLTVKADGVTAYTYVFTPVVSDSLSITEFAVYDAEGNKITAWSDELTGKTLTAKAHIINPTGAEKHACVIYATYQDKWLKTVNYDNNNGNAIASTFTGTPIDIEFTVPQDTTIVKVMLWSGMDSMQPLKAAISLEK